MTENPAHHCAVGGLIRRFRGTSFAQYFPTATDRCIIGYAAINALPNELLLEIFDYCVYPSEEWETLVHVCRRWRPIVFSAPLRLRLRHVCTGRTPIRERLCIWPNLPIVLRVFGGFSLNDDNIFAALEHRGRIYEICMVGVSNGDLEALAEKMEASFPALTRLYLGSKTVTAAFFPESFLGGSAPNLRSLCLKNIEFLSLPNLLLSAKHLVNLSQTESVHSVKKV